MSDDLGLSALTDDQLLGLGRAVLQEMARREPGAQEAITASLLAERDRLVALRDGAAIAIAAERDRQRREAMAEGQAVADARLTQERVRHDVEMSTLRAARAAEMNRIRWQDIAGVAAMVVDRLGPGWVVERWIRGDDLRVYLSGPGYEKSNARYGARYGIKKTGPYIEYYASGTESHMPGSMVVSKCSERKKLKFMCDLISRSPITLVNCDQVIRDAGECGVAAELPDEYLRIKNGE